MYLDALNKMGLPPEQTIFIDVSEENLDGAAACGINTISIRSRQNSGVKDHSSKYLSINDIGELPELLTAEFSDI